MSDNTTKTPTLVMNDKVYDVLNNIVKLALPALATFYAALSGLWNLPYSLEVVGTITALATLLGVFLVIARAAYTGQPVDYDGVLTVNDTDPEKDVMRLNIDRTLAELGDKDTVTLKVDNPLKNASQ